MSLLIKDGDNKSPVKLGRNEICWCGSNVKYKKCHLNRDIAPKLNTADLFLLKEKHPQRKLCNVPESMKAQCSNKIIKAHTISKSASLKIISENGHVIGTKKNIKSIHKRKGNFVLESIGINDASTFTGFCSHHDKNIFSKIEDRDFVVTHETCFLLAIRPFARELYAKEAQSYLADVIKSSDRGHPEETQRSIQLSASLFSAGRANALANLEKMRENINYVIANKTYEQFNHHVFILSKNVSIAASGGIFIEYDFHGQLLQNIYFPNKNLSQIFLNCLPMKDAGLFIFSWHESHNKICNNFISSLTGHTNQNMGDLLFQFIMSYCENFYLKPSWYESCSKTIKSSILERMNHSVKTPLPSDALIPAKEKYNAINVIDNYSLKS